MTDGPVEVDQQAADGGGEQGRIQRPGQLAGQGKRAGVVAAMGAQHGFEAGEQRAVAGRYAVPAMLAGDQHVIGARHRGQPLTIRPVSRQSHKAP